MKFKDHFSSCAKDYAAFRPQYPKEFISYLASLTPKHEFALDCGCGNGQLSVLLADVYSHVIAIDPSKEQIQNAQAHPKVEYQIAPAEKTGLSDSSTDLVVAAQAAHWFDFPLFYEEVRRISKPGGMIVLSSYNFMQVEGCKSIISDFYKSTHEFWPPERKYLDDAYQSIPFPFKEIVPPKISIELEWNLDQLIGYVGTWSAAKLAEKNHGRLLPQELRNSLLKIWKEPSKPRKVSWPLFLRVGRVHN